MVLRECFFAYVILVAFMLGGRTFMQWLHLSDESLTIAGGIILFLIAMRMVFPHPDGDLRRRARRRAVPRAARDSVDRRAIGAGDGDADGVARPGADRRRWIVALTVGDGRDHPGAGRGRALAGRWLGERAVIAFERLMGLVLTALAVEMLLNGVRTFVARLPQ